jgi:hypothetical protein
MAIAGDLILATFDKPIGHLASGFYSPVGRTSSIPAQGSP